MRTTSPTDPSWLCIALVRTPLDRAVSSYVHSLKYFANVGATGVSPNTSFADFALDLDRRAHDRGHSRNDGHFMPQSSPAPHVLSVPIEMLSEPDGYACPLLERLQGWRVAELEGEALEHASTHYITQAKASDPGSEHWPWPRLQAEQARRGFLSYDSFFSNKSFCRHVAAASIATTSERTATRAAVRGSASAPPTAGRARRNLRACGMCAA